MNEEPDPYAPPRAAPAPAAAAGGEDSGSLWRVVDGRLQVRHMASLPDVCLDGGPEGEPGGRFSEAMRRIPEWITGAVVTATGILALPGWLPLSNGVILVLCVANCLPRAEMEPRVLFFLSRSAMRATPSRTWWWRLVVCAVAISAVLFFRGGKGHLEAGGPFNVTMLLLGPLLLVRFFFRDHGFGRARKRANGWFELKGIAPAAIARLEEIQQRKPPDMRERRL